MKVVQACMEAGHYAQAIRMLTGLLAAASEHDEPLSQSADGSRQDTSVPEALAELQSMLSRAETLLEVLAKSFLLFYYFNVFNFNFIPNLT